MGLTALPSRPSGRVATPPRRRVGLTVVILFAWTATLLLLEGSTFGRGLDFWDEAYWLQLTSQPKDSIPAGEVFYFQFVAHPAFEFLSQDVLAWRWLQLAVLVAVAVWAWREIARLLEVKGLALSSADQAMATAAVAAATLVSYSGAGRSVSARTFVILGFGVAVAGLARTLRDKDSGPWIVGIGLVVAFLGKPTTAPLAAVAAGAMITIAGSWSLLLVGRALAGGLLTFTAFLVTASMSPNDFIAYAVRGYRQVSAGDSHQLTLGLVGASVSPLKSLLVFGPVLAVPALFTAAHGRGRNTGKRGSLPILVALLFTLLASTLAVTTLSAQGFGLQALSLTFLWYVLAVVFAAVGVWQSAAVPELKAIWALLGFLVILPYSAAIGTNNPYAYTMGQAGVFWAMAALVAAALVRAHRWKTSRLPLAAALTVLSVTTVVQVGWLTDSLESEGLWGRTASVPVLGGRLELQPRAAEEWNRLRALSEREDIQGRRVIDLTGLGEGYVLALDGRPLGRAAFFGIFSGAEDSAAAALNREPCGALASAWVLYARNSPMDVSSALTRRGVDLDADYVSVYTFHPVHGDQAVRDVEVHVLRPKESVAGLLGCE